MSWADITVFGNTFIFRVLLLSHCLMSYHVPIMIFIIHHFLIACYVISAHLKEAGRFKASLCFASYAPSEPRFERWWTWRNGWKDCRSMRTTMKELWMREKSMKFWRPVMPPMVPPKLVPSDQVWLP